VAAGCQKKNETCVQCVCTVCTYTFIILEGCLIAESTLFEGEQRATLLMLIWATLLCLLALAVSRVSCSMPPKKNAKSENMKALCAERRSDLPLPLSGFFVSADVTNCLKDILTDVVNISSMEISSEIWTVVDEDVDIVEDQQDDPDLLAHGSDGTDLLDADEAADLVERVYVDDVDDDDDDDVDSDVASLASAGAGASSASASAGRRSWLSWNNECNDTTAYTGSPVQKPSSRTKRRNKQKVGDLAKAAAASQILLCGECGSNVEDNVVRGQRPAVDDKARLQAAIDALEAEISVKTMRNKKKDKKFKAESRFSLYQKIGTRRYLLLLHGGMGKTEAQRKVANELFDKNRQKNSYKAQCIAKWAAAYLETGAFPVSKQGLHRKTFSIIMDEDVRESFRVHLRKMKPVERTPGRFCENLNDTLLGEIPNAPDKVSYDTAMRWMKVLGFFPRKAAKTYYVDGHEREDVVEYRLQFLDDMKVYERKMVYWSGDDMSEVHEPVLEPGEKSVVLIVHDECIVYSNDCTKIIWEENGKNIIFKASFLTC
jgi:hypothetical protein